MLTAAGDMQCFDGRETVRLQAPGALVTVEVAGALRTRARTREARPSGGVVLASDAIWHLPAEIVTERPALGTRILDLAETAWTVIGVDQETLGARWQCWTRNLSLALGLEHFVNLERAAWSKDAAGAPVATWNIVRTALRARVQPITSTQESRHGQRLERVTHEIHLAEGLALDENDRVVHDGAVYNVRGYQQAERIDEPLILFAEKAPWPWS